ITAIAAAVAMVGLIAGRRNALPLPLLAAAVSLAAWGQIHILTGQAQRGAWLYAGALVCAVVLGAWCPLTRLAGIPQLPALTGSEGRYNIRLRWQWEVVLVLVLALLALVTRLYALNELPQAFEAEMIDSMIMSGNEWSLGAYFRSDFMTNSAGIIHL